MLEKLPEIDFAKNWKIWAGIPLPPPPKFGPLPPPVF